jgi:spermidine/putrescine transport system substrate-binding protein
MKRTSIARRGLASIFGRGLVLSAFAASALALGIAGAAKAEELHVYAWSGELPQPVIDDFQKETGIEVVTDTFDSNESMIAKLEAGAAGYDLVNPSQYAVQILVKKGLLQELDHGKIPGVANLSPVFQSVSYDEGNKHALPYLWGTTGFAYNSDCVKEPISSWKSLWDEKYKGRIYMLDNMLAAYIAGLQVNGFKASTSDAGEIAKATQTLIDQKKLLAGYNSTNFPDLVSSGEACIVEAWSGNVIQAMATNPKVHYVLPDEGGTKWIDSYAIAKGAPNPEAAYKFLNYLLRPEVSAKVTELSKVATTNEKAKALLPAEISGNAAIYPPEDKLAKADFILDVGAAMKYYQDGWTKVKSAQ